MTQILQPSASLQPASLLSLHISGQCNIMCLPIAASMQTISGSFDDQHAGVQGFNGLIDTQEGHQVSVTGLDPLRSSPLASVLSRGLDARSVEHSPLGTSFSCSNACMEQLFKVLLASHSLAH